MQKLAPILAHVAAAVAALSGFSGCFTSGPNMCAGANNKDIVVAPDIACAIASEQQSGGGSACADACPGFGGCFLPDDYVKAFAAAQSRDAGMVDSGQVDTGASDSGESDSATPDSGTVASDAGTPRVCPSAPSSVAVKCVTLCEGRRTDGIDEPSMDDSSLGAYFGATSYLEAVSVHAFARLSAELEAHGAPRELLDAARRAELEEARHAELTAALARRFGREPEMPRAMDVATTRSIFEIARENAVEGCVRETYGAAIALFRAARATDPDVRRAMQSIAPDECRHAELSWQIAAWAMQRLDAAARDSVKRAMREAIDELVAASDEVLGAELASVAGTPSRRERQLIAEMLDTECFRERVAAVG